MMLPNPVQSFLAGLATLFGVGRLPKSPGTWGTLATVPLALLLMWAGPIWHMGFAILFLPVSIISAEIFEQRCGRHDNQEIVVDEVIGYVIAMTWLPFTWQSVLAGFVVFRFFDILKPFPISALDEKVPGGLGVVIDDVASGLVTNFILQFVATHTMWLGVQTFVVSSS